MKVGFSCLKLLLRNLRYFRAANLGVGGGLRHGPPAPHKAPPDAPRARRSRNDTITTFALDRSTATPPEGLQGLFNLAGGQRQGPGAWLNPKSLQDEVDRPEKVNMF